MLCFLGSVRTAYVLSPAARFQKSLRGRSLACVCVSLLLSRRGDTGPGSGLCCVGQLPQPGSGPAAPSFQPSFAGLAEVWSGRSGVSGVNLKESLGSSLLESVKKNIQ